MSALLRKPQGETGLIHHLTPEDAGWSYVGFMVHRLSKGDEISAYEADQETIIVLVEGKAAIKLGDLDLGERGDRMTVFDRKPPHAAYAPAGCQITIAATTACTIALCSAPKGEGDHPPAAIGPDGITQEVRGEGTNTRYIHAIAMEDRDVAGRLLVTEVYTPPGHWSSYPPHRHDENNFPEMTYLEETYYHRISPAGTFGIQRVFTDDLSLDETMAVSDHDLVLVPYGHHPCAAPHGVEMYYLNVMAGPLRKWRFATHPDFDYLT